MACLVMAWGMAVMFFAYGLGELVVDEPPIWRSKPGFADLVFVFLIVLVPAIIGGFLRHEPLFRDPRVKQTRTVPEMGGLAFASAIMIVAPTLPNFELERIAVNLIGFVFAILPMLAVAKWQRWIVTTLPPGHPLVDWSGKPGDPTVVAYSELEKPHP